MRHTCAIPFRCRHRFPNLPESPLHLPGATRLGTALLRAWDPRRPSGGLLGMMSLPTEG